MNVTAWVMRFRTCYPNTWHLFILNALSRRRRVSLIFSYPSSLRQENKTLICEVPSRYPRDREHPCLQRQRRVRTNRPCRGAQFTPLPHTPYPVMLLYNCPVFTKPSIKTHRSNCFFGSLFPNGGSLVTDLLKLTFI